MKQTMETAIFYHINGNRVGFNRNNNGRPIYGSVLVMVFTGGMLCGRWDPMKCH